MMRRWAALVLLWLTAACATTGHLSHDVEFCCGPKGPPLTTYALTLATMPSFLVAPMRDALVASLEARGLHPSEANPDALITLSYSAVYADSGEPLTNDGFADSLSVGGLRKFDARMTLEIRRASDGALVLRGTLSREHKEWVGAYDHRRGLAQIRAGFDQLLGRLPKPS
jgi:hypothetical protein